MKQFSKSRVLYMLVAVILLTTGLPVTANDQLPVDDFTVDDVYFVVGEDLITGDAIISPTVDVSWDDPDSWDDDGDYHEPDYYEIVVDNLTLGDEDTITINDGDDEYDTKAVEIHNEINLDTGSLYYMSIQPYHYHTIEEDDGDTYEELADNTDYPEDVYVITDLDVEFLADSDSITVIWDDLGDSSFEYRIVYAVGDYGSSSLDNLEDNMEGEITGITMDSDDVTQYYDGTDGRDKLSYVIDENIYPGQIYSIMVEPTTEYYEGEAIYRNRNYPYIQTVSTDIELSLTEEGDYLRLSWEIPSSFQVGQSQDEYSLVEGTITEYQDGSGRTLVIFDGDAASIGYYRITKPIWETEYQLVLEYNAVDDTSSSPITAESNIVTYEPSDYYIQPTRPEVPDLISETMIEDYEASYTLDEIYDILEEDHFVPGYTYSGSLDDLLDERVTFHVDEEFTSINFVWGAFERIDVDETSDTYGENIYDTDVYYDIYVTDELETLAYATPVGEDLRYTSTSDSHVILNDDEEIIGYKQQLNFYYDTETSEIIEITADDIYYIKIVCKKESGSETLESEATLVSVYYTYGGDSFEPPTISKPPMEIDGDETTTTSLTVRWREFWTEVISTDAGETGVLASWQHELWVDEDGTIYDEAVEGAEYFPIYDGDEEVEIFEDYMEEIGYPVNITSRTVDMGIDDFGVSDVQYYFLTMKYQTVLDAIEEAQEEDEDYDFTDYYNDLIEADKDESAPLDWQEIDPETDEDDSTYFSYTQENLSVNTLYMLMLYPYRVLQDGEVLYAHYPTPVVGATSPEDEEVTPDPTVPNLYTTDVTDTSITLTWEYNMDFSYDIVYSLGEDVNSAVSLDFAIPEDETDEDYPTDGDYYEFVVDDLFPLETYYFWIKATQEDTGSQSDYSTPASATTLDVDDPIPPRGLGVASESTTEAYGYELSVTEEHIIFEWLLHTDDEDADDADVDEDSDVTYEYSYILEVSDNAKFIDPYYIVSSGGENDTVPDDVEILDKNVVIVTELVGNRNYYARAKTLLTVTGSEEGQLIEKESDSYTSPIRIITLSTGDEYDGYIDPALTILPTEDYELVYDETGNSLEFRFRSDEEDSEGDSDNQVDQRLISSLIDDSTHEYVIDLQSFSDQEVERRRIIIPYTVMEAFDSYDVDLRIEADDVNITIPAEGIMSAVENQVKDYGLAPSLVIDIERIEEDDEVDDLIEELPEAQMTSVSVAQDMEITVKSTRKTGEVNYTDEDMTIEMKTASRYEVYDKEMVVYVKDSRADWTAVKGSYDTYDALMTFDTPKVGTYGLFTYDRDTEVDGNVEPNHWSEAYREEVFEKITVDGLSGYDPEEDLSAGALAKAAYATVMDANYVDLSAAPDSISMQTLLRAGVVSDASVTSGAVSREDAISTFVRTWEIIKGNVEITADQLMEAQNTAGVDMKNAANIAKALEMGLVDDLDDLRADDNLSNGEFFALWARVLD